LQGLFGAKPAPAPFPEPTSTERITFARLHNLLVTKFPDAQVFLSDANYKLCSLDDIALFLAQDQTNHAEYKAESFDCDDFSYRLMGQFSFHPWSDLAIGIVWTDKHALNIFIDELYNAWFIEPQDDTVFTKLSNWQGSNVRLVVM